MSPKSWLLVGLSLGSVVWAGHALSACVGSDPLPSSDAATSPGQEGGPLPNGKKVDGTACAAGPECASGQCADGVCCASACSGKCEACNLPGKAGLCEPIPDGEDPANECPTPPLPPAQDGGVVEDDAGDAGSALNLPEAGVASDDKVCAGKCNGKRACAFPGASKKCGGTFCNSASAEGRTTCDGAGHCVLGIAECQAYSCPPGSASCKTTCTAPADCLDTHFCDPSNTCKARLGNGSVCQAGPQCQSGFCVDGVCCNDACNVTGGSCNSAGKVGQCTCPACASGGACTLWYRDQDGDGFGDLAATPGAGAAPGCIAGPAPIAGYVKDHTDCDDGNASVKPGQTAYFSTPRANGSFDYNCSGVVDKELPEYVGGACGVCTLDRNVCDSKPACSSARVQTYHGCVGFALGGGTPFCRSSSSAAFHSTVACGATGTFYTCGVCAAPGATAPYTTGARTQRCH